MAPDLADLPDPAEMRVDLSTLPEGWAVLVLTFGGEMPMPESSLRDLLGVKTEAIGPRRYREISAAERRLREQSNAGG